MAVSIVRLGSPRGKSEGIRIGTVRKPPRGVPKAQFATRDFYDVWLPALAPSVELLAKAKAADDQKTWAAFVRQFRAEMEKPDASRVLDLLAVLSKTANFAVGCYCEDETHCHRSVLRQLLVERNAVVDAGH